jgi:hypothetical protein
MIPKDLEAIVKNLGIQIGFFGSAKIVYNTAAAISE